MRTSIRSLAARPRVDGESRRAYAVCVGLVRSRFSAALLALITLVLGGAGCGGLPKAVPLSAAFDAKKLEGGWHVLASNFPMWLEGKKSSPNFIYRVLPGSSPVELDDTVAYTEGGRRETIEGTDTQDPAAPSHFTWRGRGLLAAFASDWVVVAEGPDARWLVLYFTPTIATPEGVDVIARNPTLSDEDAKAITRLLENDPFLQQKARALVWLSQPKP